VGAALIARTESTVVDDVKKNFFICISTKTLNGKFNFDRNA